MSLTTCYIVEPTWLERQMCKKVTTVSGNSQDQLISPTMHCSVVVKGRVGDFGEASISKLALKA